MMLDAPTCDLRNCKHFRSVKEEESPEREVSDGVVEVSTGGGIVVCLAYPDGIPDRIAYEPDFDKVDLHMLVQDDQVGDLVFGEGDWMEDEKNDLGGNSGRKVKSGRWTSSRAAPSVEFSRWVRWADRECLKTPEQWM
jgi:hypothetical protein